MPITSLRRSAREPPSSALPIVWKLDRLGRSLRDLITMLDDLRDRGVKYPRLYRTLHGCDVGPSGRSKAVKYHQSERGWSNKQIRTGLSPRKKWSMPASAMGSKGNPMR
jgi:hypothetical protein